MSKAVRAAMVKASVGNINGCLMLDEGSGSHWTSAPVPDVLNVLDELKRLQDVEAALAGAISQKKQARDTLLKSAKMARDIWQIEDALVWENQARAILDEIIELEELLNG